MLTDSCVDFERPVLGSPVYFGFSSEYANLLRRLRFDDQELDSRPIGPVYWEGAVRGDGARGYLELTGYEAPLAL